MNAVDYNDRTGIIVGDIQGDEQASRMGIIVGAVSEVLNVREEDIAPAPAASQQRPSAVAAAGPAAV